MMNTTVVDAYPVTAMQGAMLYHSALDNDSITYHDVLTLTVRGPFDEPAMTASLDEVSQRHAVLRTGFDLTTFSESMQVVHQTAAVPLTVFDRTDLRLPDALDEVRAFAEAEQRRGFTWSRPPLLRAYVHVLPEGRYCLTLSFHHALLDGWSVATLVTELLDRYAARLDDVPRPVTAPGANYRDFVAAELAATRSEDSRRYWRAVVEGAPVTQVPRLPEGAFSRAEGVRILDTTVAAEVAERLTGIASTLGVPVRTVLLCVHLRVLALLCGQSEVTSGLLTNGRPESEASGEVLGLFLNTVPFRFDLRRESWGQMIARVFETERRLLPHRRFPLVEIRRLADHPMLVDVVFDYRDFHAYDGLPVDDRIRIEDRWHREATDVPLGVNFVRNRRDGQLHLYLTYSRREFPAEQIAAMRDHYLTALDEVASGVTAACHRTARYLAGGASVSVGAPVECPHSTVTDLILGHAERTPHRTAVVDEHHEVTYGELVDRARAVAARLRRDGVGAGARVAVHMPRSVDFAVAVVGVLLSGAAVVPLEVDYPTERLRRILAHSGATALVTVTGVAPLPYAGPVVTLDKPDGGDLPTPEPIDLEPASPAYILYTSGSTGVPKGVVLSHGGLCAYAAWQVRSFGLTADDRVAQRSPAGFDASIAELLYAWTVGAAAVVVGSAAVERPDALARYLSERKATFLLLVPSVLAVHAEAGTLRDVDSLRVLAVAGEPLARSLARRVAEQTGARVVNLYGPTEAGIGVSEQWVDTASGGVTVPIGRAGGGLHLYVVDDFGEVQPAGAPGELYIGGSQLALGYVDDDRLTRERFVPDRLSDGSDGRLYRTGDRVRMLPDGALEFLGRIDGQLKVNGVRVELTEIESVLLEHPAVARVAVAAVAARRGGHRIVAYLTGQGDVPGTGELRAFTAERLPRAAVPQHFVTLDSLPSLPNGKVDRSALPPVDADSAPPVPPRDAVEEQLVRMWSDVLGVSGIGTADDFFALGGHSLLAMRLTMRIRAEFRHDLPVASFLAAPTIAELATLLRPQPGTVPAPRMVPLAGRSERPPLFLIHGLGGQAFRYQPLARRLGAGGPVHAITARGFVDGETPHTSLADMAAEYAAMITASHPTGPYLLGGFCVGGNIALEVARRLRADGADVPLVAAFWSHARQPVLPDAVADDTLLMTRALAGQTLNVDLDLAKLRELPAEEQLVAVVTAAGGDGGVADAADLEQARRLVAVYRATAHAVAGFVHEPYAGDLALLLPGDDPALEGFGDGDWGAVVTGRRTVLPIPGDRSTSVKEPLVATTAGILERLLAELGVAGGTA